MSRARDRGVVHRPPLGLGLDSESWWWRPSHARGVWLNRTVDQTEWAWEWQTFPVPEAAGPLDLDRLAPHRIRDAFDRLELDPDEWVGRALGADHPGQGDVDRWQVGDDVPSEAQLRRVAWLTMHATDWFTPAPDALGEVMVAVDCGSKAYVDRKERVWEFNQPDGWLVHPGAG